MCIIVYLNTMCIYIYRYIYVRVYIYVHMYIIYIYRYTYCIIYFDNHYSTVIIIIYIYMFTLCICSFTDISVSTLADRLKTRWMAWCWPTTLRFVNSLTAAWSSSPLKMLEISWYLPCSRCKTGHAICLWHWCQDVPRYEKLRSRNAFLENYRQITGIRQWIVVEHDHE